MNDWSKLITVNFIGGFCGDFICSLTYNSYYGKEILLNKNVAKADFSGSNESLGGLIYDGAGFRDLDLLIHIYHNHDLFQTLLDDIESIKKNCGFLDLRYEQISKMYIICYDEDRETFIKNVQEFCRSIVPSGLKDYVILTHMTTDGRIPEFYLNNMFPMSNNLAIVSSDPRFNRYFTLLAYHKFYKRLYRNSLKESFKTMDSLNSSILSTFDRSYLNDLAGLNETRIYADRFLFDRDFAYVEEIEKIFSNIMNTEIKYDRDQIKTYREMNRSIIASYLETDVDFDHRNRENIKKLNELMDDVQGVV